MPEPSPIALFAFNRPDHTAQTLKALAENDLARESSLFVFCDGPRGPEDEAAVRRVREVAAQATGFRRVTPVERPRNLGLATSVITGVSQLLESSQTVIVIEDDMISSPFFLPYMNEGLARWRDEPRVFSLCGYAYPVWARLQEPFFLPGAHPWGWATWRRSWSLYEEDQEHLFAALREARRFYDFDVAGSYPHAELLLRSIAGEVHSWALRWIGSAILHDGLTLYPARSLIRNTGANESGSNQWSAASADMLDAPMTDRMPRLPSGDPSPNATALRLLREFHLRARRTRGTKQRLYCKLSPYLPGSVNRVLYEAWLERIFAQRSA